MKFILFPYAFSIFFSLNFLFSEDIHWIVAMQCIGDVFGVDPTDAQQRQALSIKPASLSSLFDVFLKTQKSSQKKASFPPKCRRLLF
jgi:hypothetical protein